MADQAASLDVVINSIANTSGFATAKAELAGLQTSNPFVSNFGGSLTAQESRYAASQLAGLEATTVASKAATIAERDLAAEGNAVARAASAMGIAGAEAGGRLSALGGVMSSTGALGLGVGAAIIGLGGVFEMGKSMIENADKQEFAQRNLAQAYESVGVAIPKVQLDNWIETHSKLIPSMYAAENGLAALARAGVPVDQQFRILNDALDLSIAKGIDFGTAIDDLIKLKTGRASPVFAALGIQIKDAVDPTKDLAKATKDAESADTAKAHADRVLAEEVQRLHDKRNVTKTDLMHLQDLQAKDAIATKNQKDAHADLATAQQVLNDKGDLYAQRLDQVEGKVKGAAKNQSDLKQSGNDLRVTWEKLSNDNGPALEGMLAGVLNGTNDLLNAMKSNNWGDVSSFLVGLATGWHNITTEISNATNAMEAWLIKNGVTTTAGSKAGYGGKFGAADPRAPAVSRAVRILTSN